MSKANVTLYIDSELKDFAIQSGLNLSKEFEEWIRIRVNKFEVEKTAEDPDLIIAQHRAEIMKLETQKEQRSNMEMKKKEEDMVLDNSVDNLIECSMAEENARKEGRTYISERAFEWNEQILLKATGLVFLFKKKFNKKLDVSEAKEMILAKLRDKGIKV